MTILKKFLKLQWLLEFVQTDLDKLTKIEIEKLANELSNILSITGFSLFSKDAMLEDKLTKIALEEQANNIALNRGINSLQEVKNNNVIPKVIESLPNVQSGVSQAFSNLIRSIQRQKADDKNGSLPLWEEVGSLNTKVSVKCFLEGPGIAGTDLFIPSNHIQRINEASRMLHDKFGTIFAFNPSHSMREKSDGAILFQTI